jgi:hypothetical protein
LGYDGTTKTGVVLMANADQGRANYKRMVRKILAIMNPDSPGGSGLKDAEEH